MPPKIQKSKAQKALAAASSSKAKGKKKTWATQRVREKKNYRVTVNQELLDKILAGVAKKTLITVYSVIEAYKVNGSVARKVLSLLVKDGKIRPVVSHSDFQAYTKVAGAE